MADVVLYNADCLEVMRMSDWRPVDLFITSPPYNLGGSPWPHLGHWKPGDGSGGNSKWRNGSDASNGVQYASHDDKMEWTDYVAWQREVIRTMWDSLSFKGAIFYNHKPRVIGGKLWTPLELVPEEVCIRQIITWARPGGMNFNPTAFVPTYEWIMLLAKPNFRLRSKAVSGLGDVWRISPESNDHPAPFPVRLPLNVLEAVDAETVCDCFMGSGTTGVAAARLGVDFIGMEIDAGYFADAKRRIDAELNRHPLLEPPAKAQQKTLC